MKKQLEWYVYRADFNTKQIVKYNVFNNISFTKILLRAKKDLKKQPDNKKEEWFSKEVKSAVMYAFWSKYEYEIDITNHYPNISKEEYLRIKSIPEEKIKYIIDVNLTVQERIDVSDQLMLNWETFVKYIYENLKLIKGD